ncbi:MAG: hypothetical protein AAFU83_02425, partial [Bacteroidota bacterium]
MVHLKIFSDLRCLFQYANELLILKAKKTPRKAPFFAQPKQYLYRFSGCKYKKLIFSQQMLFNYFFSKKTKKLTKCCFSDIIKKKILKLFFTPWGGPRYPVSQPWGRISKICSDNTFFWSRKPP